MITYHFSTLDQVADFMRNKGKETLEAAEKSDALAKRKTRASAEMRAEANAYFNCANFLKSVKLG